MVLATKLVIAVVALGLAVPLTTTVQKQSSAVLAPDPLIGRWNRHVNAEPIEGFNQYIELKSGNRYSFGTVVDGKLEESSFGTWKRSGQKFSFKSDAKSRQAMLLEEAELVDGTMLRFSPVHGFCKRSHPHDPVPERAQSSAEARQIDSLPRVVPKTASERDLIAQLRRQSYTSPGGTFVVDAAEEGFIIVTINQTSSKAKPIEAKVAAFLKQYGITDIAARRKSNQLIFLYECPD